MTAAPTTTEIAARERFADGGGGVVALPTITGGSLPGLEIVEQWAHAVATVERFVMPLVDTAFVPLAHWPLPAGVSLREWPNPRLKHPRESVEDWQQRRSVAGASAVGSVMKGIPLGLDPYTALDQVFIVHGRPGLYVKLKWSMVVARGHELWTEDESDESVTVCGRRAGWPADRVVRRTITIKDAQRAGWTRNDAYEKTPRDMLENRAASRVIDKIAGDVIFGLPSVEDLLDAPIPDAPAAEHVTAEQITAAPAKGGTRTLAGVIRDAERAPASPAAVADDVQRVADDLAREPGPGTVPGSADKATLDAISARFRELGGPTAAGPKYLALRRRLIGAMIDRDVTDAGLSQVEAELVLNTLRGTTRVRLEQQLLALDDEAAAPSAPALDVEDPPADQQPGGPQSGGER